MPLVVSVTPNSKLSNTCVSVENDAGFVPKHTLQLFEAGLYKDTEKIPPSYVIG